MVYTYPFSVLQDSVLIFVNVTSLVQVYYIFYEKSMIN